MKILHLPIKKKWFDMIASGIKKEEYREIKRHWAKRLVRSIVSYKSFNSLGSVGYDVWYKEYDAVQLRNGYSKNSPTLLVEFKGIRMGVGNQMWGAEGGKEYFVIELGDIIK